MKEIALYGAGGLGREVACMLEKINRESPTWNLIGFFDDGKQIGDKVSHFGKVLGGINELNSWKTPLAVALCFGAPKTLSLIHSKITNELISFPNLIDPTFSIADIETFRIGQGNIIKSNCFVSCDVTLGDFNILNGGISIGHDTSIGDHNAIMPGVRISGGITIGNENLFGTESFIQQQLKVGTGVTLSPLSALLTKPKDGNLYIGNPAKIFKY